MKRSLSTLILTSLVAFSLLAPAFAQADWRDNRQERRFEDRRDDRQVDRRFDRTLDRRDEHRDTRRYEMRHNNRLIAITPRHRTFRNVIVLRPHGHAYFGYGHHLHDDDAWRWLSLTAITLKVLDMIDEQAQREHEAAQIKAATAAVGERIVWQTADSSGFVVTTRQGTNGSGLTCREFQQQITVGGNTEDAYGTACLQTDGAWKIVS